LLFNPTCKISFDNGYWIFSERYHPFNQLELKNDKNAPPNSPDPTSNVPSDVECAIVGR